ncbi:hypothetical protein [Streptomyces sp. NBC_01465]|uniref:hypothetical protein n=1 Tax=Streptomyces sp. NBC_01465 TaxID=2903878 RepID=UPI002E35F737|nr:hypothetical protein [Streptomyces sp. NBC_01465]
MPAPNTTSLLGAGLASSAPPVALSASGAPWWILLAASLPGALTLILQAALPQNSRDRLEWWRDRRSHRERLLNRTAPPSPTAPDDD